MQLLTFFNLHIERSDHIWRYWTIEELRTKSEKFRCKICEFISPLAPPNPKNWTVRNIRNIVSHLKDKHPKAFKQFQNERYEGIQDEANSKA